MHFSTTVASFYFSGLIMTKYQKDSCILDVLPSMVNQGLIKVVFEKFVKTSHKLRGNIAVVTKILQIYPLVVLLERNLWRTHSGGVVPNF